MVDMIRTTLTLQNVKGLHARAAAKFVKTSEKFKAEIMVAKGTYEVSALSIMGLMLLSAGHGSQINVKAYGPDAKQAIDALAELVENKFGEDV